MDEQKIIIDDVNIKDCKRRIGKDNYCRYYKRPCSENNFNCIWKKYLRKEQECNKLYIQLKSDEEYHKEEENTLRKIIKNKEKRNIELYKENNKLQQTLTEIKEIAEQISLPMGTGKSSNRVILANQILQKIKEVLNGTNP